MQRREFLAVYKAARKRALRAMYFNPDGSPKPHGPACYAASIVDLDKDALNLWRVHRSSLLDVSPESLANVLNAI